MTRLSSKGPATLHRISTLHCCSGLDAVYGVQTEWRGVRHQRMRLSSSKISPASSEGEEEPTLTLFVDKKNLAPYKFSRFAVNSYFISSSTDPRESIIFQDDSAGLHEYAAGDDGAIVKIPGPASCAPMLGTALASIVSRDTVILFYQGKDSFIYLATREASGLWNSPCRVVDAPAVVGSGLSTMRWLDGESERVGIAFKPTEDQLQICAAPEPLANTALSFEEITRLTIPGLHNSFAITRVRYPPASGALIDKYCVSYQPAGGFVSLSDTWTSPRGEIEDAAHSVNISDEVGTPGPHVITSIGIAHQSQLHEVQIAYATAQGILFSRALSYEPDSGKKASEQPISDPASVLADQPPPLFDERSPEPAEEATISGVPSDAQAAQPEDELAPNSEHQASLEPEVLSGPTSEGSQLEYQRPVSPVVAPGSLNAAIRDLEVLSPRTPDEEDLQHNPEEESEPSSDEDDLMEDTLDTSGEQSQGVNGPMSDLESATESDNEEDDNSSSDTEFSDDDFTVPEQDSPATSVPSSPVLVRNGKDGSEKALEPLNDLSETGSEVDVDVDTPFKETFAQELHSELDAKQELSLDTTSAPTAEALVAPQNATDPPGFSTEHQPDDADDSASESSSDDETPSADDPTSKVTDDDRPDDETPSDPLSAPSDAQTVVPPDSLGAPATEPPAAQPEQKADLGRALVGHAEEQSSEPEPTGAAAPIVEIPFAYDPRAHAPPPSQDVAPAPGANDSPYSTPVNDATSAIDPPSPSPSQEDEEDDRDVTHDSDIEEVDSDSDSDSESESNKEFDEPEDDLPDPATADEIPASGTDFVPSVAEPTVTTAPSLSEEYAGGELEDETVSSDEESEEEPEDAFVDGAESRSTDELDPVPPSSLESTKDELGELSAPGAIFPARDSEPSEDVPPSNPSDSTAVPAPSEDKLPSEPATTVPDFQNPPSEEDKNAPPKGGVILELDEVQCLVRLLGNGGDDEIGKRLFARFQDLLGKMQAGNAAQLVWMK